MKYALFIFGLLCFHPVHARTITSFKDSQALLGLAQFMSDARDDLPNAVLISDQKIIVNELSRCEKISAAEVLKEAAVGIKRVLRFYPDEELPVEEAFNDLEDYLDQKSFRRCLFEKSTEEHKVRTFYYLDTADKIHLRMDNITLLIEGQ